jgi:hypothetical protein
MTALRMTTVPEVLAAGRGGATFRSQKWSAGILPAGPLRKASILLLRLQCVGTWPLL